MRKNVPKQALCKDYNGNKKRCKLDNKYCNPINAFGLDCYKRRDTIE